MLFHYFLYFILNSNDIIRLLDITYKIENLYKDDNLHSDFYELFYV